MKAINIAELKNNLSLYLRKVRTGEEIVVRDRDIPVAKLIPWHGEHDDELTTLASRGIIRLGKGQIDDDFWQLPDPPRVSEKALREAMMAEREGR
jgi:prevent-host-death family protein